MAAITPPSVRYFYSFAFYFGVLHLPVIWFMFHYKAGSLVGPITGYAFWCLALVTWGIFIWAAFSSPGYIEVSCCSSKRALTVCNCSQRNHLSKFRWLRQAMSSAANALQAVRLSQVRC